MDKIPDTDLYNTRAVVMKEVRNATKNMMDAWRSDTVVNTIRNMEIKQAELKGDWDQIEETKVFLVASKNMIDEMEDNKDEEENRDV